ncbi:hypothetical protein [Haloechinothrix sp. LS1_15]|uniref:ATP-binding protein n=1 Tax=Haloechinothrix sp. LS1_15 TaxID=2652248 RepID=UPI00294B2FD2|nr:hypothetical protein [Haloechinothrix sp. LS1_15]
MGTVRVASSTLAEYDPAVLVGTTRRRAAAGNVLIRLEGDAPHGRCTGWGEALTRARRGSGEPDAAWRYLVSAVRHIEGQHLPCTTTTEARDAIRGLVRDVRREVPDNHGRIAARKALLGIEVALLDLVGGALDVPVTDILGRYTDRFDATLVTLELSGEVTADLAAVHAATGHSVDRDGAAWWLDPRGYLSYPDAERLVLELATGMSRGSLPRRMVLGQVLRTAERAHLGDLQRLADRLLAGSEADLRVMAGSSVTSMRRLDDAIGGGCRAVQLNPERIGGLLATRELAEAALRRAPDTTLVLGGREPHHQVTGAALRQLAMAVPRVDHTAGTSVQSLPATTGSGLGCEVSLAELIDAAGRYRRRDPVVTGTAAPEAGNSYPEAGYTRRLRTLAVRSHLVEREALAHGLSTVRYSQEVFVARDGSGGRLQFGAGTHASLSSATSFMVADHHKGAAYAVLARAGVAVPDGQVFAPGDLRGATVYARSLGYPVVVKPVAGTGGTAVSTGVSSDAELAAAFGAVHASRFAHGDVQVERHLPGRVYRIVVLDGAVVAALLREPPSVTGDGTLTLAELIIASNSSRARNPLSHAFPLIREGVLAHLGEKDPSMDEVPDKGQRVVVGSETSGTHGGEVTDVLDELHDTIAAEAVRAVRALPGMRFCGIDMILEDHRCPLPEQAAGICELNAGPGLLTPQFPHAGAPRYVARQLLHATAREHGVVVTAEPATELCLALDAEGQALGEEYGAWLHTRATELGLAAAEPTCGREQVNIRVRGQVGPASALAALAIGGPGGASPRSVTTRPVNSEGSETGER